MQAPPGFAIRAVEVEAGAERAYEEEEWRDALVVVARGQLELECIGGACSRFERGSVLWLVGLPLRALRSSGSEPAVLVAVSRDEFSSRGRSTSGPQDSREGNAMPEHKIGTRDEWLQARVELLKREKELTRLSDELARQRRELPWVRIEKEYRFDTDDGSKTLAELFDGRSQLLVYHFMFGPEYAAGCPTCSSIADSFDGVLVHLANRDVTFVASSRASLEELQAYKRRMGWKFTWVSSESSDFNFDFRVSFTRDQLREGIEYNYRALSGEQVAPLLEADTGPIADQAAACGTDPAGYMTEGPGMSAFAFADGTVYHTYSSYARGAEFLMHYYALLDRAPKGRNEGDSPELWIRRHDEYGS